MAATTSLLGLVTPTQGTLSGTWGDTVNYGISDYVDISVAGTLTLTNDGAVTLANTTGSSAGNSITSSLTGAGTVTAQFAIVRVTGTLTTAKVVTGPSYSKTYTVVNAATGSTVTFKASGQTGVSIAVGESAFVYFNGTDYVKIVGTATAGAAGGSTTQVQYNNAGVLAGITGATTNGTALTLVAPILGTPASATLTNATGLPIATGVSGLGTGVATFLATPSSANLAAALTDETGSGANVFATSPTLVTPVLGTPTSATLTNATGLPLTTGVTGTLPTANGGTNLTSFTSGGVVYASSTSALATGSALTFDGTTPTSSNATGSPNFIFNSNANTPYIRFDQSGASKFTIGASAIVAGGAGYDFYGTAGIGFTFFTNASRRLDITSAGDLLVGTTTAIAKITVINTADVNKQIVFSDNPTYYGSISHNAGNGSNEYRTESGGLHKFFKGTSSTADMTLDASGNLGIGTSSPASKLDVTSAYVDPNATAHGTVEFNSNTSFAANKGGSISLGGAYTGTSTTQFGSIIGAKENGTDGNYAGYLAFQTRPNGNTSSERARFNSTGALVFAGGTTTANGIGITFPATQSASSDANTLDDYEEGTTTVTFTPSTSGTITLSASYQTLAYTKVGRLVTITGELLVSSVSTPVGTSVSIGNLPFAASGASNAFASGFGILDLGTGTVVGARVVASANYVDLRVNASTIGTSYNIIVGFSYLT